MSQAEIRIPSEYSEILNRRWRNIVYYGGRASLKSHTVARYLLLRSSENKVRILCTRELQKSIKDSVHKLLSDLIYQYELTNFTIMKESILSNNGSEFIFRGIRNNTAEIKSLEGIDIAWVEEGASMTESSIDILTPTIRKPNSQIIWTFNRMTELDPIYMRLVLNKSNDTYAKQINCDVAEKYGWFPEELKKERDFDKENNPALYAHKWLGEPLGQADMAVINRDDAIKAMNQTVSDEGGIVVGVDVARFGNDRTVFWKRKGLMTQDVKMLHKNTIPQLCDALERFADYDYNATIKIDDTGVGSGATDEMRRRGYNVTAINFGGRASDPNKYPNWISEAWFYLADIMPNIGLGGLNSELLMELTTRHWKMDNKERRSVESKQEYKKRGFRSPDMADACIICYATPYEVGIDDIAM